MSLERNLILSVCVVLALSLLAGAALTYEHAALEVRTEMQAALEVGRRVVRNAMDTRPTANDAAQSLARIVEEFNGDRHLQAILQDPNGTVILQSQLQPPADPAPRFFYDLVGGAGVTALMNLPPALGANRILLLRTDAHNEVSEAWSDTKLSLIVLGIFFCLVLGLVLATLRMALRPLKELCAALTRIGAGDYDVRLAWRNTRELVAVQTGFNRMAAMLAAVELQNRVLQTRVRCVQEDERRELARDLHDEVAPFLFAVSADASLIRQNVAGCQLADIDARAAGILTSVAHMQRHLRDVLARLMPDVLLDLGLSGAIETLVHFWQSRQKNIEFIVQIDANCLDERLSAVAYRVVQESLSNAVRHAKPSRITITVRQQGDACLVEIIDDGVGMKHATSTRGLGLLGMRERVQAAGGQFEVENRTGTQGVVVRAMLNRNPAALAA